MPEDKFRIFGNLTEGESSTFLLYIASTFVHVFACTLYGSVVNSTQIRHPVLVFSDNISLILTFERKNVKDEIYYIEIRSDP